MKAFHSKRVVLPGGIQEAVIMVQAGVIEAVLPALPLSGDLELIELGDQILMPGVVDTHVHINEPGRAEWEGFDCATKAAIAGGVTTLVDMPLNAYPVTTTVAALEEKIAAAKDKLHTNVGFWGGLVPGNHDEVEWLIKNGVLGFKAFLTHSGIDEFPNVTREDLQKAMPIIAKYQLPLLVHCELSDNEHRHTGDVRSYGQYLKTRPAAWEDKAIALMIQLCEQFHCPVHIVHLSAASSIGQIRHAKQKGLPVTVETGQHYLYFNAEDIGDGQTQFKCAPPIREKLNNDQLWAALKEGLIDMVATDHSPATPGLKEIQSGNFMKAWGGIASIQFALPVLWTAAKKRGSGFSDIAKWLCENPARLAGLQNQKGRIEKGFDADLIVVDDARSFTVDEACCQHRHKISPYMGQTLDCVVTQTYLAGEQVYDEGNFVQLNQGKIIVRHI